MVGKTRLPIQHPTNREALLEDNCGDDIHNMNIDYTLLIMGVKVKCIGIVTPKVHDLLVAFLL